jgi:Tfp pilus assembly protein PilX
MLKSLKKNKKGFALAMTLMILSVAMLTGLFMNSIIVGEVRVSLNTVNVVNSYYAAESGIERALYYITTTEMGAENNTLYYDQLDALANSHTLDNGASYTYTKTSTSSPRVLFTNVSNTNPAHVSIVDPQGNIGSISWTDSATGANLNWKIDNCFPNHGSDRMETTIYSFGSGFINTSVSKTVSVCDCKSATSIDSCTGLYLSGLSNNKYHKFTFRPLDSVANLLEFSMSPGIFSETLTQVSGKYKNSEYLLQAKMSALRPGSDIFSYVVFSEEDLTKD